MNKYTLSDEKKEREHEKAFRNRITRTEYQKERITEGENNRRRE